MSHYYYENAFDFIDSTGTLGYSIEQDKTLTSDSLGVVSGADNYIIEVHYLGNAATTLKLNVSNIDSSALTDVNYVQKGFAFRSGEDGKVNVDSYDTTLEAIVDGQTSYSLQQGGLDPALGMVQLHIPSTLTAEQQTALGRDSDYLYLESALYFDVIQQDAALVTSLQGLINDTVTITEFATAIDTALGDPAVIPANVVSDATNDITSHAESNGYNSVVDKNPDMIHFDNISYYSYDDFSSAPRQLSVSEGSNVPVAGGTSETSLIGEFRISENSGSEWSINADFRISQNTDTKWQTDLLDVVVTDHIGTYNINESFNNSGISRTFVEAATTISRDAQGNLSFSETVPVINTLTDSSAVTLSASKTYGGITLSAGTYSIDVYEGNDPTIVLREIIDSNANGYFSYGGTQAIQIKESEGARYSDIVADINNGQFTITNPMMISDGLGTQWNGVSFTQNPNIYYEKNDGSISSDSIPQGKYLVSGSGNDITLTKIGADTDYDQMEELDNTSAYKLYVNETTGRNEVEYLYDSVINDPNSSVGDWENYVKGTHYETSDTVIPIMDELGTTWNSVVLSGASYTAVDGTSIPSGTYKVIVSAVDGSVSLQATTVLDNGDYDVATNTYELRSDSQTTFVEAVNRKTEDTYDYTYKQYFYDLINTNPDDIVDKMEIVTAIEEHVNLLGGTKYVEGTAFDNTGINSINTADISSITSIDAGDETDFIAGGGGGFTIDGGSGMDMYFATPASINIVEDQDGNIISERGVTVALDANRVIYLKDGTEDIVSNIEYFMGTLGDDLFYGSALHATHIDASHTSALQVFNGTGGKDEIFGAKDDYDIAGNLLEVFTAVDYDSMQGGQGAVFILDGSDAATNAAVGSDELSFTKISEFAGDYWDATSWAGDGWLPSNDDILNSSGNFSTKSRYEDNDGATLILDTFGDTDLAFDIDHYIGSDSTDIFFGSAGDDSFDAGQGAGNFMSGGGGLDQLVVTDYNDVESDGNGGTKQEGENLNLNSMEIDRVTDTHLQNVFVDGNANEIKSDAQHTFSGNTLYRIDFADVPDLSTFFADHLSTDLYNVSSSYELYLSSSLGVNDIGAAINGAYVQYVTAHNKIDIDGNSLAPLNSLSGHLVLQETTVSVGEYIVKGTDDDGNDYSTVIKDVEQVVLTDDEVNYFGTGKISGAQEDIYQLIQGGQGDLGEMLYVTTGQTIDNATGASNYSGGLNFNSSEVFYSGHHTDFDRNSSRDGWAASVGQAFTASEAKVWNDEVAQFFVWYDADATDNIEGYEIAVKYQNGDINAWGIDNRQFDTFQNVTVDQTLADAIKAQFGDSVSVELGEYRVLYEAAYTDIETIVNSNADVTKWNFDFQPTSSRSTFYIQVGGGETGLNGSAGISDTLVTNIKVERVADGADGFEWNVNPQAEILVNLPILPGDANDNVLISGDSAETIEAGKGSDVMMGQGGSDNYKISAGDTRDASGNDVVGSYGVAGDVINEIGGSSEDKSDAITLSSAKSIDELSFSRTQIASEYWDNTLKIDVKYDSGAEDTLYVFDHYNQDLSSRAVEQLFLDDGWDSSEIWNLIVGDFNEGNNIDEYDGTSGQDVLLAGTKVSNLYGGNGQDIMIGDSSSLYSRDTTFELGDRNGNWDQVADIIQGFGSGDHLDLSALGISDETEIKVEGNQLQLSDDTVVAEFSNFNDGLSLEQLLTVEGAIIYSAA